MKTNLKTFPKIGLCGVYNKWKRDFEEELRAILLEHGQENPQYITKGTISIMEILGREMEFEQYEWRDR